MYATQAPVSLSSVVSLANALVESSAQAMTAIDFISIFPGEIAHASIAEGLTVASAIPAGLTMNNFAVVVVALCGATIGESGDGRECEGNDDDERFHFSSF